MTKVALAQTHNTSKQMVCDMGLEKIILVKLTTKWPKFVRFEEIQGHPGQLKFKSIFY